MIAIVDYGVGNLFSLSSSVRSLGAEVRVTRDAADLRAADHILLPGVAFCRRCANAGVKAIIATDISRDGTMQGTNMALYRELLTIPGIEVTASGGIAAMAELAELSAMHCHAAILGKSIYTGAIDLAEAVRLYESK